jgi:polar amino acid transport system substrate-binding protein
MGKGKRWWLFVAVLALVGAAASLGLAAEPSRLDEVLKRGKLIVAVTSEIPPMGYIDEKGELVGFDIDIAKLVAKAMFEDEKKIEFVKTSFDARWPSVQAGKVDFGIMMTTIWPNRLLKVNFTRKYLDSGIAVIARKGKQLKRVDDLNSPTVTIARLNVPSEEKIVREKTPKAKILVFAGEAEIITAVKTGRADAGLTGVPVARYHAKLDPNLEVMETLLSDITRYGLFMRQNDFQLWKALDDIVAEMRHGSLYTEYSTIHRKWFGVDPPKQDWYLK